MYPLISQIVHFAAQFLSLKTEYPGNLGQNFKYKCLCYAMLLLCYANTNANANAYANANYNAMLWNAMQC